VYGVNDEIYFKWVEICTSVSIFYIDWKLTNGGIPFA